MHYLSMDMKTKLVSAAAMGLTALVVSQGFNMAWRLVTGSEPPQEDDGGSLIKLALFAGASAMIVAVAQRGANKQAQKFLASR